MSIGLLTVAFLTGGRNSTDQLTFFTHRPNPPTEIHQPAVEPAETQTTQHLSPEPQLVPIGPAVDGSATHYGAQFNGRPLGCGTGFYSSSNAAIVAVGPSRYREWLCGTQLSICGTAGCIVGVRHDACPGCGPYLVDLSEAGIALVCGAGAGTCRVQIQAVTLVEPAVPEPPPQEGTSHESDAEAPLEEAAEEG